MSADTADKITFTVDVQPLPKQRPRVVNGHAHTPTRTRTYERTVGWLARAAMRGQPPLRGDVAVTLEFLRKGTRRADLDNMIKAVLDGLNGIVYEDDLQVVRISSRVVYESETPGVRVVCERVHGARV